MGDNLSIIYKSQWDNDASGSNDDYLFKDN